MASNSPNISVNDQAPDPHRPIRLMRFFSYPDQVLYLIASFIGLVTLCHFFSLVYTFFYAKKRTPSASRLTRGGVYSLRYLPRASLDLFRAIAFRWTIPVGKFYTLNVTEVFLTAAYAAILFTWSLINSTTTTGVKVEAHYWANRAGTIAASQLPIMTALGMRNNPVSFLTGVSFDKLNYLHRMSARVLCVLVWLHGAGRLKVGLMDDESVVNRWVQCGFLAASALTVLCITTLRPIRERGYEIFLVILTAITSIFLLSLYYHARGRRLVFYGVWPSFVLWGLDRFLRLLRIVVFNPNSFRRSRATSHTIESSAIVDVLSSHFLRVTLLSPSYFHWLPGQSAYLTFPGISKSPLEAHPFTISTIDHKDEASNGPRDHAGIKRLVFLVRIRNGFTQRLLEKGPENGGIRAFLDGPYSSPPLLVGYETVILIAGGSGVAFTLPLLLDLLHRSKKGNLQCSRIVFLWAIRDADHVGWISETLNLATENIPSSVSVEVRFFVTAAAEDASAWDDKPIIENEEESKAESTSGSESKTPNTSIFDIQSGRPDLKGLLHGEISRATGSISVNVCGTYALAGAVRSALRTPRFFDILRGGPTITLHVEAFGSAVSFY